MQYAWAIENTNLAYVYYARIKCKYAWAIENINIGTLHTANMKIHENALFLRYAKSSRYAQNES
jgi:hypothetical protein